MMRSFAFVSLCLFLFSPAFLGARNRVQPEKRGATPANQPSAHGTQESPLVVKVVPASKTQAEIDQEAEDRKQRASSDLWNIRSAAILAGIAFLQLLVYGYQSYKLKQTVESAGEQSEAMERHIGEASRSANAMEGIASVIEQGNKAIIRAYMSVIIGAAVYQERQDGVRFEGKPSLVNTGSTPARNVHVRIAARIMSFADSERFEYPLPGEVAKTSAIAAPHQTYILSGMVTDFVPDAEISDIKAGRGKALTVWGVITYDDIFGDHHTTKFGQWLFWYPNQTVYGFYIPGQNDMD